MSQHDTHQLPPGGYYFAPGAVEQHPARRRWLRAAVTGLQALAVLLALAAASGLLGYLHG